MEVTARAPGKIFLSGEHAVVHGSTAVAASINLYTYVRVRFPSVCSDDPADGIVKLQLDKALEFSWSVGRVRNVLKTFEVPTPISRTLSSCSPEMMSSISVLLQDQESILNSKIDISSGVSAFLWLFISILGFKSATVVVTSELPMGSGLGSSASFCVSLAAAFLSLSDSVSFDRGQQGWLLADDKDLELINLWAFEGEKIIHGKPSGIDNTASTYGNTIAFRSGHMDRVTSHLPLRMLVTNTRVPRNTKALVGMVMEKVGRHPATMASVFEAVDSISRELVGIIGCPTGGEEKVKELIQINQGLLLSMGVSHPSIEAVLRITSTYGLASKLTGAGGGGCVLTLLPQLMVGNDVDKVVSELAELGFESFVAGIGGNGVEIRYA